MIDCPACGYHESTILWQSKGQRKRSCNRCLHEWTTEERHPKDRVTLERLVRKYSHELMRHGLLEGLEKIDEPADEPIMYRLPVLGRVRDTESASGGKDNVIKWFKE